VNFWTEAAGIETTSGRRCFCRWPGVQKLSVGMFCWDEAE